MPATVEITAVADTWIGDVNDVVNHSALDYMYLYTWPADTAANWSILKWDLSSNPASPVRAIMRLYILGWQGTPVTDPYTATVHRITGVTPVISACTGATYDGTNQWTGNNFLNDIGSAEGSCPLPGTRGYVLFDITDMVQDWLATPSSNKGLMICPPAVAGADADRTFASSEHAESSIRPKLFLSYATAALTGTATESITEADIV